MQTPYQFVLNLSRFERYLILARRVKTFRMFSVTAPSKKRA